LRSRRLGAAATPSLSRPRGAGEQRDIAVLHKHILLPAAVPKSGSWGRGCRWTRRAKSVDAARRERPEFRRLGWLGSSRPACVRVE
jgi:hypothetical protein